MMNYVINPPNEYARDFTPMFLWTDVAIEMLSARTIRAAHQYVNFVDVYDSGAYREQGLTPTEMELKRVRLHNSLIRELQSDHVELGVNERTNSRELAQKIRRWLCDD